MCGIGLLKIGIGDELGCYTLIKHNLEIYLTELITPLNNADQDETFFIYARKIMAVKNATTFRTFLLYMNLTEFAEKIEFNKMTASRALNDLYNANQSTRSSCHGSR